MKVQDIFFVVILVLILLRNSNRLLILSGIAGIIVALPLFVFHVFFTAERLVMYAAAFFLIALILSVKRQDRVK